MTYTSSAFKTSQKQRTLRTKRLSRTSVYQLLTIHNDTSITDLSPGVCIESKTEGKVVCNSRKHLANNIGSFAQPWSGQTLQLVKPLQNKSTWQWLYLTAELIFVIAYILGIMNYKTNYDWEWMSAVAFALATVLAFVSVIGTLELQQTLIALNTTGQTWTTLGFGVLIIQWIFVVASAYLTWLMWSNFCRGAPEGAEAGEQQVDNE